MTTDNNTDKKSDYRDIDKFTPLSLGNNHGIWSFSGKLHVNSYLLLLKVNLVGGSGFTSIQIIDHEVLTLARGLTKVLKSYMTNSEALKDFISPISQRGSKSLELLFKQAQKSVSLQLRQKAGGQVINGHDKIYIEISLEKAQLLRMKCIELLSFSFQNLPHDFLAQELLVSISP